MTEIIVISSFVAASSVGGSIAPATLAHLGLDCCLAPTTLLGRRPDLGSPGGSAVPADRLASLLEGVEAHSDFEACRGILTGYFASPEQVEIAARTIDKVKATVRPKNKPWLPPNDAMVFVDPIMGDFASGLYIREDTAAAIKSLLIQRADLITPNLWEFAYLARTDPASLKTPEAILKAAEIFPCDVLITSVMTSNGIGAIYVDKKHKAAWLVETPKVEGTIPKGTGDLVTLLVAAGLCENRSPEGSTARAIGATAAIIDRAMTRQMQDLPIAASGDLIREPPYIKAKRLR